MNLGVPESPKIYHIVHVDRLSSIISKKELLSDAEILKQDIDGTTIGMDKIKKRRLEELTLKSHPNIKLYIGECVPFYFCPRSTMLYILYMNNHPEISYRGGQPPIIHLEADLHETVAWANKNNIRWAFTTSNAGSRYFQDYNNLSKLDEINWNAVHATTWTNCREEKQAEFLIEKNFPWQLIRRIGTQSDETLKKVEEQLADKYHIPTTEVIPSWYY